MAGEVPIHCLQNVDAGKAGVPEENIIVLIMHRT
jgi:hypothetical protein